MDTKKILTYENLKGFFEAEPAYRLNQFLTAWFSCNYSSFSEISTLPKKITENLDKNINHTTIKNSSLITSSGNTVFKAILTLYDEAKIETVLMYNKKNEWTICVSSQVGCRIGCAFCATGTMGFKRNLDVFEIAEQYLFWKKHIKTLKKESTRISNIVIMGMGEPLLNYDNIKQTLNLWLKYTDTGPNYITISTVGILNAMEKLLLDPEWPKVKIAVSLHSADNIIRKSIVPSHTNDFFPKLKKWCNDYIKLQGARTRPVTFEYVLIENVNDSSQDAEKLVNFLKGISRAKVNLIPYNTVKNIQYHTSRKQKMEEFQQFLSKKGIIVTVRKSLGQDILAACGQLIT